MQIKTPKEAEQAHIPNDQKVMLMMLPTKLLSFPSTGVPCFVCGHTHPILDELSACYRTHIEEVIASDEDIKAQLVQMKGKTLIYNGLNNLLKATIIKQVVNRL